MYAISQGASQEGIDFEKFKHSLFEICAEHINNGTALAFAFILYDFSSPQYLQLLQDKNYWLALDEISGDYLSIFTLNPNAYTSTDTNYANPSDSTNELLAVYGLESNNIKFPALLFFQINDAQSMVESKIVTMNKEAEEESFLEVKHYISEVVQVLKRITPANRQEHDNIFNLLKTRVEDIALKEKLQSAAGHIISLAGFLKLIYSFKP